MQQEINVNNYDFLDFGASKGGSIDYCCKRFHCKRGLGIDIDPVKANKAREAGYECLIGDLTQTSSFNGKVRFVSMMHFLEHLPNLQYVEKIINTAVHVATDFIYIVGPSFDHDEHLKSLGFKLCWSDWKGHTCPVTIANVMQTLDVLKLDYVIFNNIRIRDSMDTAILPIDTSIDQICYDGNRHSVKKYTVFNNVFREFICYVRLDGMRYVDWKKILKSHVRADRESPLVYHRKFKG